MTAVTPTPTSSPSSETDLPIPHADDLRSPSCAGEFELVYPTASSVHLELCRLLMEGGVNGQIRAPQDKLNVLLRSKHRDCIINVAEDVALVRLFNLKHAEHDAEQRQVDDDPPVLH